jgi:hypothetical protein
VLRRYFSLNRKKMARNVLIPTDFTVKSLQVARYALENSTEPKLDILLFHMVDIPHSITDLLFFSKEQLRRKLIHEDFKDACAVLRNKYASIVENIQCEIFYGSTPAVFENYVNARKIDQILYNNSLPLRKIDPRSIDSYLFIKKSKKSIIDVSRAIVGGEGKVDLFTVLSGI